LGTRNNSKEGRPYEWKTFREVYDIVDKFARGKFFIKLKHIIIGIHALNLSPETMGEGVTWNFLGIFSKNREEWAMVNLACMRSDITIVPFYDSLGKDALALVLNSTEVTTMCIEKSIFDTLVNLKQT
jgi:long-subunit acyl-CoA synthetase (AMP-forming)